METNSLIEIANIFIPLAGAIAPLFTSSRKEKLNFERVERHIELAEKFTPNSTISTRLRERAERMTNDYLNETEKRKLSDVPKLNKWLILVIASIICFLLAGLAGQLNKITGNLAQSINAAIAQSGYLGAAEPLLNFIGAYVLVFAAAYGLVSIIQAALNWTMQKIFSKRNKNNHSILCRLCFVDSFWLLK